MRFFFKHRGSYFRFIKGDHVVLNMRRKVFENQELDFVISFLKPGHTFWDIGANFGLFTVLGAKKVGRSGTVVAFEPAPLNYRRLRTNLWINGLFRVKVERVALGREEQESVAFIQSTQGAYSGLSVGAIPGETTAIRVPETTLDAFARTHTGPVDLVKMDVEGGERDIILGGRKFFSRPGRPVVLAELDDERTVPVGYPAREIYHELETLGYHWFSLEESLKLKPQKIQDTYAYVNLVACPEERLTELLPFMD